MKPTLPRFGRILLVGTVLALAGATLVAATPFHFGLVKSVPADKATVSHASEVRLWFSEAPSEGTVSIRVIDAAGNAVPTTDPAQDPQDEKAFGVAVPAGLTAGDYSVAWRGMGDDGHVVRGEFAFSVSGH